MTKLNISAYKISRCGYYEYGSKSRYPKFGTVDDILDNLLSWTKNQTLKDTFLSFSSDVDLHGFPVYCFDIRKSNKTSNFVLILWNELPHEKEGIQSASSTNCVGKVTVKVNKIGNGDIPGVPTYFYFVPHKNVYFNIRRKGPYFINNKGLVYYFEQFLKTASKYVICEYDGKHTIKQIGYAQNNIEDNNNLYIPHFDSERKTLPGKIEYLKENCKNINKVINIQRIKKVTYEDINFFNSFLNLIGLDCNSETDESLNFRSEFNLHPTLDELNTIIKKNSDINFDHDVKNRIGFKLTNIKDIFWLDKSYAVGQMDMNLEPSKTGMLDADNLLKCCDDLFDKFMNIIGN